MAAGNVDISFCNRGGLQGSPFAVGFWGSRKRPMFNTEHNPGLTAELSQADAAAEQFRARLGQAKPQPSTEPVWVEGHQLTGEQWEQFKRDRFHTWHSEGWVMSVSDWLAKG